jgi:hypothetical protein
MTIGTSSGPAPCSPARPQLRRSRSRSRSRSRTDRMIGGVGGGLDEYSGIDSLL